MAVPGPHHDSDRTRRFRAAIGWSGRNQESAAADLGVDARTLRRYEKGQSAVTVALMDSAIQKWDIPGWLLPGDASAQGNQGAAARQLADFSQRELDQAQRENPEEPGSAEDKKR
jgi:transcriptional regulator with XRE-family HTH domain